MRIPGSESELRDLIDQGLLRESHRMDFKEQLGAPSQGNNRSLAKDLAAFSVDGGLVVVGVAEDGQELELRPIVLAGLAERVEQIGQTGVDEPVSISCLQLSTDSPDSQGMGYLLILVSPSDRAPHMVDGKYYGRGDRTNIVLSDAEVLRLHEKRLRVVAGVDDELSKEILRDPALSGNEAHLFMIALPATGSEELLLKRIEADEGSAFTWISHHIMNHTKAPLTRTWSPDFSSFNVSRRAEGWGVHNAYMTSLRTKMDEAEDTDLLDLEIGEDGSVRLFCGRASDHDGMRRVLFEDLISGLCLRVLLTVRAISEEAEYLGSWHVGVGLTNLHGVVSYGLSHGFRFGPSPYSEKDYRKQTTMTPQEVRTDLDAVVDRLLGRLYRAINHGRVEPLKLKN